MCKRLYMKQLKYLESEYQVCFENHYMHTSQFHQPTSRAAQFCQFVGKNNILDLDLDLEPLDHKILQIQTHNAGKNNILDLDLDLELLDHDDIPRIQTHNAGLPALVTNCQIFCRLTAIAVAGWR